jgi:isocitrate lyase
LKRFIWDLAKEGFVLQLVSLAGLHSNAVGFGAFISDFERSIRKLLTALRL